MKCNFFLTSLCSSMYICKFGQKIHTYHFPLLFWMYIRFHSYCFILLPTMINDYIHTSIFFCISFIPFFCWREIFLHELFRFFLCFFFGLKITKIFTKSFFPIFFFYYQNKRISAQVRAPFLLFPNIEKHHFVYTLS